ncbi:hypothetical protein HY504_02220 [Candidatus Wolfebacteria bacterium]|nr:hypothetical protein [Candidatus Wolfebacteria bacterium]
MKSQNRKLIFFYLLGFFLISHFLLLASSALAESQADVTCRRFNFPWCGPGVTDPANMVNRFYQVGLGLAGAAAFGVMIYGAILYTVSAGNTSMQGEAKQWITGALWGVGLLLGAYLILYTINPRLVNLRNPEIAPVPASTAGTVATRGPVPGSIVLDAGAARGLLERAGIRASPDCVGSNTSGCVSFAGVRQSTIDEIIALENQMRANLVRYGGPGFASNPTGYIFVTSVTEGNHAPGGESHATGHKIDIRLNPTLNRFIEVNYSRIGTRSDGAPLYQSPRGSIYAREGDHWDVLAATGRGT